MGTLHQFGIRIDRQSTITRLPIAEPARKRAALNTLPDREQRAIEFMRKHHNRWWSNGEVANGIGIAPREMQGHLRMLVHRGFLDAEGNTVKRRWRVKRA